MNVSESKAEQILGIVFAILGALFSLVIIPWQIKDVKYDIIFNSPRFFPTVVSVLFIILGAALFITGRRKRNHREQEAYALSKQEAKLVFITLGVMILYTALLYFLPYIPVTIVAVGFLIWLYGQKSWRKIVITSVVLSVLIYVGFRYGLSLKMP